MQTAPVTQPDITPVAQPAPMMYRPPAAPDAGQGNLMNLARSLSNMDSTLGTIVDQRQQQSDQYDKIQAQADFVKNNSEGYSTAVQQGKIPAYASPSYVSAYKQAEGGVAGFDLQQKFDAAYDAWGGKNSDDPNAYHQFVSGFLAQNVASNDKDVLAGLMPHINQMVAQGQAEYIQDKHNATVTGFTNATTANMDNSIVTMRNKALSSGTELNLDGGWKALMDQRTAYTSAGGKASDIDNKLIDTITSQAIQARGQGGVQILSLLDRNVPGTNYTYAETPYGQAQKEQTLTALENMGRRAIADAKTQTDAANKAELGDVQTRVITSLIQNPGQPVPEALIRQGEKAGLDPEFRVHVAQWQDTLMKNAGTSNPQDLLDLNWSIMHGGGMSVVTEAMENGKIKNRADLQNAVDLVAKTNKAQDLMAPIMKSAQVTTLMATIKQRTLSKDDLNQTFAPGGMSNAGLGLAYSFQRQLQDWALAHPNANEQEQQGAIAVIGKGVLDSIGGPSTSPTVTIPQGAPPNPYLAPGQNTLEGKPVAPQPASAPAAAPQAKPPAPPPQRQPQQHAAVDPVVVDGWYKSLPPQTQTQLATYAQQRGESLAAVTARAYAASGSAAPAGQSASPFPGGQNAQPGNTSEDSGLTAAQLYSRNLQWVAPGAHTFNTALSPQDEGAFRQWLTQNKVPFDPNETTPDYDMRGFWEALQRKDPKASSAIDPNDGKMHYPDYWKTPYDATFSNQSQWATKDAPHWTDDDKLVAPDGKVVWDDKQPHGGLQQPGAAPQVPGDLGQQFSSALKTWKEGDPNSPMVMHQLQTAFLSALHTSTQGSNGSYTLAALKDNPKAAHILDFVAGSETRGDYNAYYGGSQHPVDLSKGTVNQVLSWQKQRTKAGSPSSATGRYQFTYATLSQLKTQLGLTGSEKFTPQLQDTLALQLLKNRGYDRWRTGKMSDTTFANNLAEEWAALPNMHTGQSHYEGDGLNHATVTPAQVSRELGGARAVPEPQE